MAQRNKKEETADCTPKDPRHVASEDHFLLPHASSEDRRTCSNSFVKLLGSPDKPVGEKALKTVIILCNSQICQVFTRGQALHLHSISLHPYNKRIVHTYRKGKSVSKREQNLSRTIQRTSSASWSGKWQPTPVFLSGKLEAPGGLQPKRLHRVGHD